MTLALRTLAMAAAVAAAGSASAKDWAITPSSAESVVLMRANHYPMNWGVMFNREGSTGFGSRVYILNIKSHETAPFEGRTFGPGTYQLNRITQQSQWSTCFGSQTVSFTVQPGKVYYLGLLNDAALLADLQRSAQARGKTKMSAGSQAMGWSPQVRPEFFPPSAEDLAEVQRFVSSTMPRTTARVEPLITTPSSFRSSNGEKVMQICG